LVWYSLKATYEAIHLGVEAHEFSVGRDSLGMGDGASDGSIPTAVGLQGPRKKKRKWEIFILFIFFFNI